MTIIVIIIIAILLAKYKICIINKFYLEILYFFQIILINFIIIIDKSNFLRIKKFIYN